MTETIFYFGDEMDSKDIEGKEVLGAKARVLGKVCNIEIDTENWKVTHISMEVDKNAIEELGFKKPRFGSVKVDFPVEKINGISDRILLNESTDELKKILRLTNK